MDIIDKIFQKLRRENAPASLQERILNFPRASASKPRLSWLNSFRFLLPVAALILLVAGFGYFQYFRTADFHAAFELSATDRDAAGIKPGSVFVLKSSKELAERQVKGIVEFSPAVDYSVEADGNRTYKLIPQEPLAENKIYAISIKEGPADHEYSWAFQVKAPFSIVKTIPGRNSSQVPINSAIEITFNRTGILQPEKFISIQPQIQGRYEVRDDMAVFLPKSLSERTVYTVTVKAGLKSEATGEALEKDYSFSFETGERAYTPYSEFNFSTDFLEFQPGKKPAFEVYSYNFDTTKATVDLYRFDKPEYFLDSYQKSRKWEYGWTYYYRRAAGNSYQPDSNRKVRSFPLAVSTRGYQSFVEFPDALPEGYYLIDILSKNGRRQAWLQITPVAHYFSITGENSLLWLYDFTSQKPLAGVGSSMAGGGSVGSTNQDGLMEFRTPEELREVSGSSAEPRFLRVELPGSPEVIIRLADTWGYQTRANGAGNKYWNYISTDRYAYQLSDSVHYWGIVRGRSVDMRGRKVTVAVYGEGYYFMDMGYYSRYADRPQPLVSQEVMVSQFDTIQGELAYRGFSPGYYTMVVSSGDEVIGSTAVQVLSYSKPAYQITVTPSQSAVFAGDQVIMKVKASFFDGTPVPRLALNYNGYWNGQVSGSLTLNDSGEGSVAYTPAYQPSSNYYYPASFRVSFAPKKSEEGEIEGSASVLVFGPNIYLQARQEHETGDTYKFTAKLNKINIDNKVADEQGIMRDEYIADPASDYRLSADIVKTTYVKTEVGDYYDYINKTVQKSYRYDPVDSVIETVSGNSNQSGEWTFSRTLPRQEFTYYHVRFYGADMRGRALEANAYAYYANFDGRPFGISLSLGTQTYENQYSVGDKVKLELRTTSEAKPLTDKVLYYRYQNSIGRAEIVSSQNFEESFDSEFAPSVQYTAVVLGPYGFQESNSVFATIKKQDRELKIDMNPEKASVKPGENIKIGIMVKDRAGKPVSSEVNLAAVDEALFHVLPYNWQPDILQTLYRSLYYRPLTGYSQYSLDAPGRGGAEGGGCFLPGTDILLNGGASKPIEDIKVGDVVLTRESAEQPDLRTAVVQGVSWHYVRDYLLINGKLGVTPEHEMVINGKWSYAGSARPGDLLLAPDGSQVPVVSIEKKAAPQTKVYNIVVGKYHTYFAEGAWVHNAEKGGSPRSNFLDVALYQSVHTGSDGKAEASFKAPDNMTSWRVTALAYDPSTISAGSETKLVSVSLPLFADATIAASYLSGDSPILRLRAFGTEYKSGQYADFTLKSPSLKIDKKFSTNEDTAFFPLPTLPAGVHEIVGGVSQGDNHDSLARTVSVVPSYFKTATSSKYLLSDSLSDIAGSPDGYTRLTFSDAGKGRYYEQLLWNTYRTGLRSDELTAAYASRKLLQQYFGEEEPLEQLNLDAYTAGKNGGVGLFSYADPDLTLTAQLADVARDYMPSSSAASYMRASLRDTKTDIHRSAVALYGLASLQEPVLSRLQQAAESSGLDRQDKLYIALGLARLGDKEEARKLYLSVKNELKFQGGEAWLESEKDETRRIKMTALYGSVASAIGEREDTAALWNYLSGHSPQKDLDMLEMVMIARDELARPNASDARFTYTTKSRQDTIKLEKGQTAQLRLSSEDLASLKFSGVSGSILAVSSYEEFIDPASIRIHGDVAISRTYLVAGRETQTFNEGDIVQVRLDPSISASAVDGGYQVVDFLPSGLRPITPSYAYDLGYGSCQMWSYPQQIAGSAVYFSYSKNIYNNCGKSITYYARVVTRGTYKAEPSYIQSAKDSSVINLSKEAFVTIK